jgi:hypothetical protein
MISSAAAITPKIKITIESSIKEKVWGLGVLLFVKFDIAR